MVLLRKIWPPRIKPALIAILALVFLAILAAIVISFSQPKPVALTGPQAQEIAAVLQRAERLFGEVGCNRSISVDVLDDVLVDWQWSPPGAAEKAMIARVFGWARTANAGLLTARKAYYLSVRGDYPGSDAPPENGLVPTTRPIFYCPTPAPEHLVFIQSIAIGPDRAVARYDNGPALIEATLINVEGFWKIASLKYLNIHF
jgi:hypothetical protein